MHPSLFSICQQSLFCCLDSLTVFLRGFMIYVNLPTRLWWEHAARILVISQKVKNSMQNQPVDTIRSDLARTPSKTAHPSTAGRVEPAMLQDVWTGFNRCCRADTLAETSYTKKFESDKPFHTLPTQEIGREFLGGGESGKSASVSCIVSKSSSTVFYIKRISFGLFLY